MESTGQEVGRIETRLRQLGARLDKLVVKADEAGAEVKVDYRKQIDHIKDKHAVVQSKLTAFRAAGGQKWENFKGGVEVAWHDLENAFKALKPTGHDAPAGSGDAGEPAATPDLPIKP
jgi:phage-related minor tail protein